MRIAVNTRMLLSNKLDGIGWFSHEVLSRLVKSHPEHEFLFLFDRAYDDGFVYAENVQAKVIYPPARHPLLYRMFFEYSTTLALRQWKADLYFSPDGFLSTKTRVAQVPVIHDINFEHRPEDLPSAYTSYYRSYFPRFAAIARDIITVSNFSAQDIADTYGIDAKKIHVAHNGCSDVYHPLSEPEKLKARKVYTMGAPYFIFIGNFSYRKNIHGIVKAYDQYRNSGGESKLILVGNPLWRYAEMDEAVDQSAFAADIIFPGHLPIDALAQLLGGAQALVFPSYFEGFGIPVLEAFKAGVPVISSNTTSIPEIAGEAALLLNPDDVVGIAEAMALIEKDSVKLNSLISSGLDRSTAFSWDSCANKVASVLF